MQPIRIIIACLLFISTAINAQNKKAASKKSSPRYPESFTISSQVYDVIMNTKVNELITSTENKYINKAKVVMHSNNGDMQFVSLRLSYFAKSNLLIQVNGEHSTKIFLMSDDKTLSYNAKLGDGVITFTKCSRDEIVSE